MCDKILRINIDFIDNLVKEEKIIKCGNKINPFNDYDLLEQILSRSTFKSDILTYRDPVLNVIAIPYDSGGFYVMANHRVDERKGLLQSTISDHFDVDINNFKAVNNFIDLLKLPIINRYYNGTVETSDLVALSSKTSIYTYDIEKILNYKIGVYYSYNDYYNKIPKLNVFLTIKIPKDEKLVNSNFIYIPFYLRESFNRPRDLERLGFLELTPDIPLINQFLNTIQYNQK